MVAAFGKGVIIIFKGTFISPPTETLPETASKVRPFFVRARWLSDRECRFDASYYIDDVFTAEQIIKDSGFKVSMLSEMVIEIFAAPISSRFFADNGVPYLVPNQVFEFRPVARKFVINSKIRDSERWYVKEGWLLISQSGVVGRFVLATKQLEGFIISQNLLRIIPFEINKVGYLYAFLSSSLGQTLMTRKEFGSTVSHLLPSHLANIPVPIIPEKKQLFVHRKVMKAYQLRFEANKLLDESQELIHEMLELPRVNEWKVSYFSNLTKPKAFTLITSEINERFDASFHLPIKKVAFNNLHTGRFPLIKLGGVAQRIFIPPRFKRIYVPSEYGIPFLRPSDLPMMKPYDQKYLSRRFTAVLDKLLLRVGDVLVTTDGTVGRIGLVPRQHEGWAGSNNLGRITYSQDAELNGYVAAFLMSAYGYYQLTSEIYGNVVDHLEEEHLANIWLPNAPLEIQKKIGNLVVEAFEKKEEANQIEKEAIDGLEKLITAGKIL